MITKAVNIFEGLFVNGESNATGMLALDGAQLDPKAALFGDLFNTALTLNETIGFELFPGATAESEQTQLPTMVVDQAQTLTDADSPELMNLVSRANQSNLLQSGEPTINREILNGLPQTADQVKYNLLETSTEGNVLSLKLAQTELPNNHIELKLPIESLENGGKALIPKDDLVLAPRAQSAGSASAKTMAFDWTNAAIKANSAQPAVDQYLRDLNVDQIELKNIDKPAGSLVEDGVEAAQVTAKSIGNEVLIRSRLRQTKTDTTGTSKEKSTEGKPQVRGSEPLSMRASTEADIVEEAVRETNNKSLERIDAKLKATINVTNDSQSGQSKQIADRITTEAFESGLRSVSEDAGKNDKIEIRPVKIMLPTDAKNSLRPGSQAVTVRMTPDHLGPARLEIRMIENVLTARLTVNSVEARIAVEKTLDQLVQQLGKADIEVDRVEVNVRGEMFRNDQFNRHPLWHQISVDGRRYQSIKQDEMSSVELTGAMIAAQAAGQSYVGASGVNVLA